MRRGTVLHHSELRFEDGASAAKYLVVLNCPQPLANYLCCKTTSRQKDRPGKPGCHSRLNLFVLEPCPCFRRKTWVQFHDLFEFSAVDLLQLKSRGIVEVVGELDAASAEALVACVRTSDDISPYYLSLLDP